MKNFFKKLLYTLTLIFVLGYGTYTVIEQQVKLNQINKEKEMYMAIYEEEKMKHEQLIEVKENLDTDAYIEEVAREKLGLVMPYEIIFVDASI